MDKILIVDDEKHIVEFLTFNLKKQGYSTLSTGKSTEVFDLAISQKPDCILLDIMMPEINGYEVCRRLKLDHRTKSIPIIMITAKGEEADSILGLGIGADDYIVKPFSIKVLFARIEALIRRYKPNFNNNEYIYGDITLDTSNASVQIGDYRTFLTPNELVILETLVKAKGSIVTRDKLLNCIDSENNETNSRVVDVHISSIRKKISSSNNSIKTIRGKGYVLDD